MYGQIMNIYLNYNFISDCLKDTTSNDEVFLFKFLSKICNGINSSLGGLTQLEPILEDDNILKIIDQNPIPGIANSATFGNRFKGQITPFEIFGYNTANMTSSGSVTSNFVRDFGFVTKIDPSLASMITIGATKEGTKSKNYDGTAFSKWNEGLEDAYAMKYDDPNSFVETNIEDSKGLYAPLTNENINAMETYFNSLPEDDGYALWFDPDGYQEWSDAGGKRLYSTRDIVKCPVTGENFGTSTWKEYFSDVMEFFLSQQKEEPKKEEIATNYIQWLAVAFQGVINGTAYTDPNYFQLSEDFISLGKQLWKSYKTAYDNLEYETNQNPSNVIGFIPIDANIKIDGLSGIRIYQELTVQQGVLPPAYPKAVKFLITKNNPDLGETKVTVITSEEKKSNIRTIARYLKSIGVTREGAIGFIGNVLGESGANPQAYERSSAIGGKGGVGIVQWTAARRRALEKFSGNDKSKVEDINNQLTFLGKELSASYSGVLKNLKSSKSIADSTAYVLEKFEVPATYLNRGTNPQAYAATKQKRINYALSAEAVVNEVYNK